MVVNGRPFKRLKRRVTADLYDFLTFPSEASELRGPFRTNVRSFLSKHARLPPPSSLFSPNAFPHLLNWQIFFRVGDLSDGELSYPGAVVTLDVVEEEVTRSRSVYCDQCRVVGWSGHPVCVKRYHFIIRADKSTNGNHACPRCRAPLSPADIRCKTCNIEITGNDAEDSVLNQLEDATHLLHGVIHTNGYGHLLRVNGREGGSKFLSGRQIMDFWDRLCTTLEVRKISVIDVSKKFGMDFRLLHALTNGRSWYGNWGYEFLAGSFALTSEAYHAAVKELSNIPIAFFCSDGNDTWLREVTACYTALSGHRLATVKDLFCFIFKLLEYSHNEAAVDSKTSHRHAIPLSRCSDVDVKRAECAMIKVLKVVDSSRWVAMSTLRGAAFRAGSPQLIDYCIKQLAGRVFDSKIVDVRQNPITEMAEYRLCDKSAALLQPKPVVNATLNYPSGGQLFRDLRSFYDKLLNSHTQQTNDPSSHCEAVHNAVVKLLDCKQFIKDYCASNTRTNPKSGMIYASCEVTLNGQPVDYSAPPPELVVLPEDATVGDLKREATRAFQDVYVMFRRLHIEELTDYSQVLDSAGAAFLLGADNVIRFRGICYGNTDLHPYRMERGTENWTVECVCGAKDDDGERMMACDKCEVWHHTRCAGISDVETVPVKFICSKCSEHPAIAFEGEGATFPGSEQRCRDEIGDRLKVMANPAPFTVG